MQTLKLLITITLLVTFCGCADDGIDRNVGETITLEAVAGRSVFQILQKNHEIDYDSSTGGVFIQAIDGIRNEGGHFWTYSVNGKPATVACDNYLVNANDTIIWKYE
ncbi:MAG: DUF4430 domain-containing protein [candidate division Zixibacteria bacterium]|nr:DUF4430 domain-containing protein [candidate division Zixibacteria bacterium]